MLKIGPYIKDNWKEAAKWLSGARLGLLLAKACDFIWPDMPIVVKEVTDTVTVVHSVNPIPAETDSLLIEQLQRQLMSIELINKYEESSQRVLALTGNTPCKMITGDPYLNSHGYTEKSSSPFCSVELVEARPFLDIKYHFIRNDYADIVNTLDVKIIRKQASGNQVVVFDQHFLPQAGENQLIRIVDDLSPGDYTLEAGFYLKEDINKKYPTFYSQTLKLER